MMFDNLTTTLFSPLRAWVESSNGNWNMLIVIGFVLVFVGAGLIFLLRNKIGKEDERTNSIYLKSSLIMLSAIVLCDLIFPKEYMWQIFFLFKYSLAFIAAAIYLAIRYKKDFSS
nr:DUF2178 domain-containing protein [Metabacillus lacus]